MDYNTGSVYSDIILCSSGLTSPSVILQQLGCVLATLDRTKDIDSHILQSVDTERTGLAGDLKIRGLDETLPAILYPTCSAADLLAANSAQTAQEHFVEGADLSL